MFLSSLSPVFAREYFSLFFRLFYLFYTTNVVKRRWQKSSPVLVFFFFFQVFVFRCTSFPQSGVNSASEIGSIFRLESVVDHRYQVLLSLRAILSTPVRKKVFLFLLPMKRV